MRGLIKGTVASGMLLSALVAPVAVYAQAGYPINLPPQTLAKSLRALASQAHINVVFDPDAVKGTRVRALKGNYGFKAALTILLDGTDFRAVYISPTTVVIRPLRSSGPASNSDGPPSSEGGAKDDKTKPAVQLLPTMTVLGSLIPRSQMETSSPLITITAQEIKAQGFSSVADALQNLSVNTGAVNNNSLYNQSQWAVKTISLFGLNPSYTKFLIDGRPMPNYSAPNLPAGDGTDQLYTNLAGIPIDLVERIEILPGGQSSLYGSDAIAGVVNIVLKKHAVFGKIDARYGWYSDGGGRERMLSAVKSFQIGKLSLMVGGQVNDQQPMWALQRSITAQNFAGGINPQRSSQNVSVRGLFSGTTYFPAQPNDCSKLASLWGGSEGYHSNFLGGYCGSASAPGYTTLINKQRGASLSVHADYAVNDELHFYADLLDSYQEQSHQTNASYSNIIYDSNLDDLVAIQRTFAPEERANSLNGLLTEKSYENTSTATFGGNVNFGHDWALDVAFTRSLERNNDRQVGLLGTYATQVLGPQQGTDPFGDPIFAPPNYNKLVDPLTPAQYAAYTGTGSVVSTTRNDQLRAQLTQTSLFALPGGDAGLALVAESGYESWKYLPSPLLLSGELQGFSFNPSDGHRNRSAVAAELNLPVSKMLTADLSARYDSYNAQGAHFGHETHSLGLEFRPFKQLLLRGRYATSFKAPTLIDMFEGVSVYPDSYTTDYVNCARLGYTGDQVFGGCPFQYASVPITEVQASNPNLKPMTAKSFSYGMVWSPTVDLSMHVDYLHTSIRNEVLNEYADFVMLTELQCEEGTLDPSSPTCQAIKTQIQRAPASPGSPLLGQVLSVTDTKINVAHEINNSIIAGLDYNVALGHYGLLGMKLAYTRVVTHRQQNFPGDPVINLLTNPGFSTEFKSKANFSLTWHQNQGKWNAALLGTYFGATPNFQAQINNGYDVPHAGRVAGKWIYNGSVSYSPTQAWQLSLRVNNILNSMPPIDITAPGSTNMPFSAGNYNPYGREIFVEASYQFGRSDD